MTGQDFRDVGVMVVGDIQDIRKDCRKACEVKLVNSFYVYYKFIVFIRQQHNF